MLILVVCIIMGIIGMMLGEERKIGKGFGFLLGFLLGLIGIVIVLISDKIDKTGKSG